MKALLLIMALLLTANSASGMEVPLEVHGPMLLVEATINDRFTGRFLLDTGASLCVISQETAKRASIRGRTTGPKIRVTTAAGPVEATLAEAKKIEVDRATARDVEVAILEGEPAPGLAGLLGSSFLNRFHYKVDSEKGVLRLDRK